MRWRISRSSWFEARKPAKDRTTRASFYIERSASLERESAIPALLVLVIVFVDLLETVPSEIGVFVLFMVFEVARILFLAEIFGLRIVPGNAHGSGAMILRALIRPKVPRSRVFFFEFDQICGGLF